jgi:hypothetical protein
VTPTARSLAYLRACGFLAAVVERWLPHANVRKDAFGWADLLACHPVRRQVALIQVTTRSNLAARIAKTKALPDLAAWLAAGGLAWFHGWYRRAGRWQCHAVELTGPDLAAAVLTPARRRGRPARQRELFDSAPQGGGRRPTDPVIAAPAGMISSSPAAGRSPS